MPSPANYNEAVNRTFNAALIWHMDKHGTGVAELSRATGVSLGAIKMMRSRPEASTSAENAAAIARFYGKTVADFMACRDVAEDDLVRLLDLLTPDERAMLEAQVRGLLSSPSRK